MSRASRIPSGLGVDRDSLGEDLEGFGTLGRPAPDAAAYLAAHDHAVRWAVLNRRMLAARTADALGARLGKPLVDVCHNGVEVVDGRYLHRKGAAPGQGCDVLVAGTRGTRSYLVAGHAGADANFSVAHGAGRKMSRADALRRGRAKHSIQELRRTPLGSLVVCGDRQLLFEEAPGAYKRIDQVVGDLVAHALATPIATTVPLVTYKAPDRGAGRPRLYDPDVPRGALTPDASRPRVPASASQHPDRWKFDLPVYHPADRAAWRAWLAANHEHARGVWVVSWRRGSGLAAVPYDELVEEALCVGWIDSTVNTLDDQRGLQLMTPRKPKSNWTRLNRQRVADLEAAGLMTDAGRRAVEGAKANGRWTITDSVEDLVEPADLTAALDALPAARAAWDAFPPSVRKQMLGWLVNAGRPQTRVNRVAKIVSEAGQGRRALG